jgi:hypothetical protein
MMRFIVNKVQQKMTFITKKLLKKNKVIQILGSFSKSLTHQNRSSVSRVHVDGTSYLIKITFSVKKLFTMAVCSLFLVVMVPAALATGTVSGTLISNFATITYSVEDIEQAPLTSTTTTFLVDNMVNLTVAETSGTLTSVAAIAAAADVITTFTVTNNGNTFQDYVLTVGQGVGGQSLLGKTDNFDATGCTSVVESDANIGFQPLQDTATFIDELAPDITKTVYVLCSIPAAQLNDDVSIVSLLATTYTGNVPGLGLLTAEDTGADTAGAVQVVFSDTSAGDLQGDNTARNGQHSARDGYWLNTTIACNNPNAEQITLALTPFGAVDSGSENNTPAILTAITGWIGTDTEGYKDEQGGSESGSAQGWYSTIYNSDLSGADIVWGGASNPHITGPTYLLVKGGKQQISWYLFDVSSWDGMETISLSGFWPGQDSISHLSIFNAQACDSLLPRSIKFDWPDQDNNQAAFVEAFANDGSISIISTLTIINDTFTEADGAALTGATVSNVPPGLTAVLTRTGSTTATLSLNGNATAHANANDIANLTVSLSDTTFTLGNAASVIDAFKNDIVIDFIDSPITKLTSTIIDIQHPSSCSKIHSNDNRHHNDNRHRNDNHHRRHSDDDGCELVPGSVLTYQIQMPVTNNMAGLVITNPIATNMTYVSDSIFVNGVAMSDANDGDSAEFIANNVIVTAGIISATTIFTFTFCSTIN